MRTAKELFAELNSFDENRRIEAKSASAVGKSMMETVCAFANEPGLRGGYLILGAKRTGIAEDGRPVYEPENIENTDKIQSDFVAMCNSMFNVRIRPIINVEEYLGKTVIVVKIEELPESRSLRILQSVVCLRGRFVVLVLLMKNAQKRICIFSISLLIPMIVVL